MSKLLVVACAVLLATPISAAAEPRNGARDWSDERGAATAERMLEGCLTTGPKARDANLACIDGPFDACTRENGGTMSQHDLNVCRRYSYEAWRKRYEKTLVGFDELFRTWTKSTAADWQRTTAARFQSQEETWRRWVAADCEMWELGSLGGSIHNYAVGTCNERHIALRAIELAPLLEWLQSR
jgi:hypothetical protein